MQNKAGSSMSPTFGSAIPLSSLNHTQASFLDDDLPSSLPGITPTDEIPLLWRRWETSLRAEEDADRVQQGTLWQYAPTREPSYLSQALKRWDDSHCGAVKHNRRLWLDTVPPTESEEDDEALWWSGSTACHEDGCEEDEEPRWRTGGQPGPVPALVKEDDDGPLEYKLVVTVEEEKEATATSHHPVTDAFVRRARGMARRLGWARQTGKERALWGKASYEIGVADNGTLLGLSRSEADRSLANLEAVAEYCGAEIAIVQEVFLPCLHTNRPETPGPMKADSLASRRGIAKTESMWKSTRPDIIGTASTSLNDAVPSKSSHRSTSLQGARNTDAFVNATSGAYCFTVDVRYKAEGRVSQRYSANSDRLAPLKEGGWDIFAE